MQSTAGMLTMAPGFGAAQPSASMQPVTLAFGGQSLQSIVSGGNVTDSSFSSGSTSGGVTGFSGTGGLRAAALAGGSQALGGTAAAVQPEAAAAQASQGGNQPAPPPPAQTTTPPPTFWEYFKDWVWDLIGYGDTGPVPMGEITGGLDAVGEMLEPNNVENYYKNKMEKTTENTDAHDRLNEQYNNVKKMREDAARKSGDEREAARKRTANPPNLPGVHPLPPGRGQED